MQHVSYRSSATSDRRFSDIVRMCSKAKRHFSDRKKEPQVLVGESWAKFVDLWRCGKSATFHIKCKNGNARLHFSTLLGRPEGLSKMADTRPTFVANTESPQKKKKCSPSKLKRNQLRLQAFLEKKRRESTESVDKQLQEDEMKRQESCSNEDHSKLRFSNSLVFKDMSLVFPEYNSADPEKFVSGQVRKKMSQESCSDEDFRPPFGHLESTRKGDVDESPLKKLQDSLRQYGVKERLVHLEESDADESQSPLHSDRWCRDNLD